MADKRRSKAWYVKYEFDAYALGPLRFETPVSRKVAEKEAVEQFGEKPHAMWPA